jgi:flagellar export protein FliJ
MSGFKFRLEKVRRHRERLVDKNSLAVAKADRRVARLARQIVELEESITRQARSLVPGQGQLLRPGDLIAGSAWLEHLQTLKIELVGRLEEATRDLARHRVRLTESWRDLEILSRLRDRQQASWQAAEDRRERREADEIGRACRMWHGPTKVSR